MSRLPTQARLRSPLPDIRQVHTVTVVERVMAPTEFGEATRDGESFDHKVEVVINMAAIVKVMGKKAVENRTGKSCDGFVVVKRIGKGTPTPQK